MKTFFKGFFSSFWGLTSLYLVNIQPNSKFDPPQQTFLDALLSAGSNFFLEPPFEICWVRACVYLNLGFYTPHSVDDNKVV